MHRSFSKIAAIFGTAVCIAFIACSHSQEEVRAVSDSSRPSEFHLDVKGRVLRARIAAFDEEQVHLIVAVQTDLLARKAPVLYLFSGKPTETLRGTALAVNLTPEGEFQQESLGPSVIIAVGTSPYLYSLDLQSRQVTPLDAIAAFPPPLPKRWALAPSASGVAFGYALRCAQAVAGCDANVRIKVPSQPILDMEFAPPPAVESADPDLTLIRLVRDGAGLRLAYLMQSEIGVHNTRLATTIFETHVEPQTLVWSSPQRIAEIRDTRVADMAISADGGDVLLAYAAGGVFITLSASEAGWTRPQAITAPQEQWSQGRHVTDHLEFVRGTSTVYLAWIDHSLDKRTGFGRALGPFALSDDSPFSGSAALFIAPVSVANSDVRLGEVRMASALDMRSYDLSVHSADGHSIVMWLESVPLRKGDAASLVHLRYLELP